MQDLENPYKNYFKSLPCYLTVQDRNFKIIDANSKFISDFGNFEGRYCYQAYKQRPVKCDYCAVEKTFEDGRPRSSEEEIRSINGQTISVLINTTPIRNADGEIIAVLEMSTDITDIKKLQKQLKENENRYRILFEEVPCYISIQDRDLNIINANRLFKETFSNSLGLKCYKVYKQRDQACYPCIVQETFRDGNIHQSEELLISKTGKAITCMVNAAPIRDINGKIIKVIEMSTDITELRELQDQLTSVGLLISSVSHSIKGLLNGINGGIYIVNKAISTDNKEKLNQGWEIVVRNINKIKSIVMDILYYTKEREPQFEVVEVADIIEQCGSTISQKASDNNIEIIIDIQENIGKMECDKNAIQSVLINILDNSIDACRIDKFKDVHSINFSVVGDEKFVYFKIRDNGIGMDDETKSKAFSLFFSSKRGEGTGLGLFIANKIVTSHNGEIKIKSKFKEWTEFIIKLNRKKLSE